MKHWPQLETNRLNSGRCSYVLRERRLVVSVWGSDRWEGIQVMGTAGVGRVFLGGRWGRGSLKIAFSRCSAAVNDF
jgi:hypothetical protein